MRSVATRRTFRGLALLLLVAIVSSVATGCAGDGGGPVSYAAEAYPSGDAVSVESLRGRPVLLVSWATWCRECDEELAGLQAFAQSDAADGLQIVAVNIDAASVEDEIDAKISRNGLDVTQWRDRRNNFKRKFGALGVPTTVLLDADGNEAGTFPGAIDFEADDVLEAIEEVRVRT